MPEILSAETEPSFNNKILNAHRKPYQVNYLNHNYYNY